MNKAVLVTGASGQLGKCIALQASICPDFDFTFVTRKELDLNNSATIDEYLEIKNFDIIINCAAYTAVDMAESEVETVTQVNYLAVKQLAEICKTKNIYLIHFSTDYVFNGKNYKPYIETDIKDPRNIYGKTKLKSEEVLNKINPKGLIIRTSWVYSEFGNNFVESMLQLGKERGLLNVVFDQIGSPTYAGDIAKAVLSIIKHPLFVDMRVQSNTYNYSNEGVASWYDFSKVIFNFKQIKCKVNPIETKDYPTDAKRPHYSLLNKTKIKETFGLDIPHWMDSLKYCLEKM